MRSTRRERAPTPRPILVAAVLAMAFPGGPARGEPGGPDPRPPSYPSIATIRIEREDVFDLDNPDERHLPYIWANKLHIETREYVIRRELLFKEGDPADPNVLYESERNLRRLTFLHANTNIEAIPRDDGRVDVVVHTRDAWTTQPGVSFSRQGNRSTGSLTFLEQNLLGLGKSINLQFKQDLDRRSGGLDYFDPRLLGSRWTLDTLYFRRSDGILYAVDADRPFYSVMTASSGGGGGSHFTQVTTPQIDGHDGPGFRQRHSEVQLRYGRALRTGYETTRRIAGHVRLEDDRFDIEPGEAPLSPLPPVGGAGYVALPDDRRLRVLEAVYEATDVRYRRVQYLDKFDRFQDINLGNDWSAGLGMSPRLLGDVHTRAVFSARYRRWFHLTDATYTSTEIKTDGRFLAGAGENVVTGFDLRHYYLGLPRQTMVFHVEQTWGHNLDGDRELLLGGDSGLRGYDSRRFDGNKRLLLNVEDRAYMVFDWLHLLSVAFSPFADAGYVWRAGESEDLGDVVGDVGVGLRFDVTRGGSGTVIRLDYAYPLSGLGREENPRGVLSLTAGQAF